MPLPLTGSTLAAYNNLPAIPPQEPLGDLLNSIGGGGGGGARGVVLNVNTDLLSGPVNLGLVNVQPGRYKLQARFVLELDGTSGGDGATLQVQVDNDFDPITQGRTTVFASAGSQSIGFVAENTGFYAFVGQNGRVSVETEVEVNVAVPTTIAFEAAVTGSPTDADVLAGSSLTLIPLAP